MAAFVWCELPDPSAAAVLATRFSESAHNSARYCTALPWEDTDDGVPLVDHLTARATLAELRSAVDEADDDRVAAVDAAIARARGRTNFDAEIARMYRAAIADPRTMTEETEKTFADRLGRSPTRSCDRLRLANVEAEPTRPSTVRFSVRLAELEDFAPLGPRLCELGCRIQVLPIAADDLRAEVCF